ncbi:zinc finger protein 878 isoform X2 [Dunckerocampus dactyliophorus]|uniref:zinc finger protein 878 isoform X2 n=1 Tax=Dunckerocampus dactyliophorus TaxID=161453 RepID=UPI002405C70C|nr:zinc finger protein 878 isoform X2 [Dunckerocampus dactyliophorus]
MSVEYTIDIQLTELGFPIIHQPPESLAASRPNSLPSCHSPNLTSNPHKENLLVVDQPSKELDKGAEVSPCPSESGQEARGTSSHLPLLMPHQEAVPNNEDQSQAPQQNVEGSDSDDSNVSVVVDEEDDDEEEEEEGLDDESANSGDFVCSVCGLHLPSDFKLQDHMNLHTGVRPYCCAECGKRFSQIHNYRAHLRTHAQTKVENPHCRICLRSFLTAKALKDHLARSHWQNEFYECDLCKRVFTCLSDCQNHVELHRSPPDVICDKCGRHFNTPKSLKHHLMKSCYTVFKCTDCTKTFKKKDALLKHSFSHLGLLPYTCVRCRRHFRLAKLYRHHKCEPGRVHCVACLREFGSQEEFEQHKKDTGCWGKQEDIGDTIRCLECGLRFATSEELKKHAGAHQRVLKCAECGKGFRSALLLMSHMGGHAGNSPCLCKSCGLGFPHQHTYDSHLKTCGQSPQPANPVDAPKKHGARKNSSLKRKLDTTPTDSAVSELGTADVPPSGSDPSDGCWKLTLDKIPPPGVDLVLFVPVAPDGPQFQSPADPQKIVWTRVEDAACQPLDLSKKKSGPILCNPTQSDVPPPVVKSEPVEFEISEEAERQELVNPAVVDHSYCALESDIKKEPPPSDWQAERN